MVKVPETMSWIGAEMAQLGVPPPDRAELGVTMRQDYAAIADRIGVVGSYLSRIEYVLGYAESHHLTVKEAVEMTLMHGLAQMDPKLTIKAKEAALFADDPMLAEMAGQRVSYGALIEQLKGWRNAYRAQYDALSRMLSAKQLEAELVRA